MNWYRHSLNIKAALFLLGVILISGLVAYSQKIVTGLREDNRILVNIYAELMASAVKSTSDENLDFIFEKVIKNVSFPVIQSDVDGHPVSWRNLPGKINLEEDVAKYMKILNEQNEPIPLVVKLEESAYPVVLGYLHYGDSRMIAQLNRLPYLEIIAVGLFIILGFIGFNSIRNSEKRSIWVGMARETAHQLGTPVSALMGWIDHIEDRPERISEATTEMKLDLERLKQVNDRFSEMGSFQKKEMVNIIDLIGSTVDYIRKRIPGEGQKLVFTHEESAELTLNGNAILLSWAIENILKNCLDATSETDGLVSINAADHSDGIDIVIEDNGTGIPRKDWKNVFRPGFSTKKHGWGLGLSLTKRIIEEMHDGTLSITRSTPGKGTTFAIRLKT